MTHLRKMMLEELERRNYSQSTVSRAYIQQVSLICALFQPTAGSVRSRTHSRISGVSVSRTKVGRRHSMNAATAAFDSSSWRSEEELADCRNTLSAPRVPVA